MTFPASRIALAFLLAIGACDNSTDAPASQMPTASDTSMVVSAPIFSPAAGSYTSAQAVTITSPTPGVRIHFTTDGSVPTTASPVFAAPIELGTTATFQAIAVKSGMTNSKVSRAAYVIALREVGSVSDGVRSYQTVRIGTQTWMAENLAYAGTSGTTGSCYGNSSDSCLKYGRLYSWAEAINGASLPASGTVRGICPAGWHLPSDEEWTTLVATVEADPRVGKNLGGKALKSTTGWRSDRTGTDLFGFNALPAGMRDAEGISTTSGTSALFWSSTQYAVAPEFYAWYRNIDYAFVFRGQQSKSIGHSVRCIQD